MAVRCPQCARPAEITNRYALASTDGPLEHVKISCRGGHWFTVLAEDVEVVRSTKAAESTEARLSRQAA